MKKTASNYSELYYDPYRSDIHENRLPFFKRLREDANRPFDVQPSHLAAAMLTKL